MSYRFCYGPSGSGKSYELHKEIMTRAGHSIEEWIRSGSMDNFLYIVPEQYTMQTQKDLVLASRAHGIMNVDVLSFGRLAHRLFEEAGVGRMTVLDDIGKNLILMRIAGKTAEKLPAIGSRIHRFQMISEVKSAISEFMQYGLTVTDVQELARYAEKGGRKELAGRLSDLSVLYEQFLDYERDRFITSEETLDRMAEAVYNSALIRSSTLVFDGFTGFTPVQYRVLEALMQCAKEVIFCITLGEDGGKMPSENDQKAEDEQERLFYLSRKTMRDIMRIAKRTGTEHGKDIDLRYKEKGAGTADRAGGGFSCGRQGQAYGPIRFRNNPLLSHLERSLFRYPAKIYTGSAASLSSKTERAGISITEAPSVSEEVRSMCIRIRELVRTEGYCYRDIAVVTGDLPGYADDITRLCALYDIPVYVDRTRRILCNPLTEAIRSALKIAAGDYSYQTMFRFLRSGLMPLTRGEIDHIENYCLARGVTSRRKWEMAFDEKNEQTRQKILAILKPLMSARPKAKTAESEAGEETTWLETD
ncbi:MAG: hypothetical protein IJV14_14600 [Lachnospiraceae bacterium]|nr:hypothetical protein [Lachnospiraceae bacterium]